MLSGPAAFQCFSFRMAASTSSPPRSGMSSSSSFCQCSPCTLHLLRLDHCTVCGNILSTFSHLCWFGEDTAVLSFNRPESRGMRLRDSSYSFIHCSCLIVDSAIFHHAAYPLMNSSLSSLALFLTIRLK